MKKLIFFLWLLVSGSNRLIAQNQKQDYLSHAIDSLMTSLKDNKEDSSKVKTLLDIAWKKFNRTWSRGGDYESAIDYAKQGLALAEKVNFKWGKGRACFVLGMCWNGKADYTESLKYHFSALKISFENKNKILTLNSYFHIGKAYNALGNYSEALKNHFAALNVIRELNENNWYPDSYASIGNVYLNMKNYPEADKYFADAYSLAEKMHSKFLMGEILLYTGSSLLAQSKHDSALTKYKVALKIFQDQPSKSRLASTYTGIANVYCKKGSIEKDSLHRQQFFTDAISYYHKSLVLDKEIGFKNGIISDYSGLAEAYRGIKDYKNALAFYDLYTLSRDSSYNKDAYVKIAELKIQYETEKATVALKAKQQMNNLLLMGLILVVITSVFLFFYLRQRNDKKRAVEKADTIHKMSELEMQSLRSQLNPHFMFNSLNSIQELILLEENDKSHIYLSRFSKLLRILLENAEKPFIPLQSEIDFLQLYLDIENLRVPDLQYSIETDPVVNTAQILIPNMILQPFIENAIWHGLAHKTSNRQLQIRIFRENETMNYEIEDNGIGRKKAEELKSLFRKKHISKGMELLTKRFRLLNKEYGTKINITITDVMNNDEVAGTLVSIKMPSHFPVKLQKSDHDTNDHYR